MKYPWIVVMAAACGAAKPTVPPPAAATNVRANPAPEDELPQVRNTLAAPRPDVDLSGFLPDPTERARWPLTIAAHPELEPHFNIAAALAEPGVGWLDLCKRGAQHRHLTRNQELVEYLGAWCSVATHDSATALYQLGRLYTSSLRDAIRFDVADIIADHGASEDVEGLLSRDHLMDHELVDLIAAAYFDVGRPNDAYAMNELSIAMDRTPSDEVRCRRFVRGIVAGRDAQRADFVKRLHAAATPKDPNQPIKPDATCVALDREMRCWVDPDDCTDYLSDSRVGGLVKAYASWPKEAVGYYEWYAVCEAATRGDSFDVAYRLALPALELALRTSQCEPQWLGELGYATQVLAIGAPAQYRAQLESEQNQIIALSAMPRRACLEALVALPAVKP
jgi:hypothetical protein